VATGIGAAATRRRQVLDWPDDLRAAAIRLRSPARQPTQRDDKVIA
jgi:hypothetical protein